LTIKPTIFKIKEVEMKDNKRFYKLVREIKDAQEDKIDYQVAQYYNLPI
jgi:hypothetical protein